MKLVYIVEPSSGPEIAMPSALRDSDFSLIVAHIESELVSARTNWPPFNTAHEGIAVLMEEVDELWEHVKTNQRKRDLQEMRKEAIQVAAMAVRFAMEVCTEERGRK